MSYTIREMPAQIAPEKIDKYLRVETATVGHRRFMGFMDPAIQCLLPGKRVAGTAVTLALPGQDTTLFHHAIGLIRPGDFLCIDRLGDQRHACLGGGVAAALKAAGCVGVAIDGLATDLPEIEEYDLPVWCRGLSPITTRLYDVGGALNVPVACGGAVVMPGDVVIADFSGVLVIPPEEAEAEADWALDYQDADYALRLRLLGGAKLGEESGASALVLGRDAG
ncbi:MAG: RraA family protein [Alphaproteobacteria bacterium]|jgi:regulator of RNase E activity RraA|nr:RraA family protein [Alphaproteobacteria bacterium]